MPKLAEWQYDQLARPLIDIVTKYFSDPKHVEEYKEWYFQKYGKYPTEGIGISGGSKNG